MCCDETSHHPTPSHPGCESCLCPAHPLCLYHLHLLVTCRKGCLKSPPPHCFSLTGLPPNKDIESNSKKEMEVSKCHSNMQPSSQMPRGAVSAASLYVAHNGVDCDVQHFLGALIGKVGDFCYSTVLECTNSRCNLGR